MTEPTFTHITTEHRTTIGSCAVEACNVCGATTYRHTELGGDAPSFVPTYDGRALHTAWHAAAQSQ